MGLKCLIENKSINQRSVLPEISREKLGQKFHTCHTREPLVFIDGS